MFRVKRARSLVHSIAHYGVNPRSSLHPRLGEESNAQSHATIEIDLLTGGVVTEHFSASTPTQNAVAELSKRFLPIAESEGIASDQIRSARITFEFERGYWPSICWASVTGDNNETVTTKVDGFGRKYHMSIVDSLGSTSRRMFERAGWWPGRRFALSPRLSAPRDPAAAGQSRVLSELKGLQVVPPARVQIATSDIWFTELDGEWREPLVESKFPTAGRLAYLGMAERTYVWLFVNASGQLIAFPEEGGGLYTAGNSVAEGIERLLLGYRWNDAYGRLESFVWLP